MEIDYANHPPAGRFKEYTPLRVDIKLFIIINLVPFCPYLFPHIHDKNELDSLTPVRLLNTVYANVARCLGGN